MKYSTGLKLTALAAVLMLAACQSKPPATVDNGPAGPSSPMASSSVVPGSEEDLKVNVGDTVHFAYNEYDISADDQGTLARQAAWLQKYGSVRVTVEGHCDERGTREYNLALGARRANAVKSYLVSQGVSGARIDTISYGKERPICTDSSEDCYAQNRRGVTVVTGGASS
ncbi:MAG TPA: peptidoglycan-associated lipoprotein Pal [Rhizomicrobium sp.]|jgi:peptidoglycan-associated lipoprotein|nr:peptidoglycan-associated lipoprotein Pal [Rhizomicrobium sp.]